MALQMIRLGQFTCIVPVQSCIPVVKAGDDLFEDLIANANSLQTKSPHFML
jgi:hypothetical protein